MENPIILLLYLFESFLVITLGGVLFGYSSSKNFKSYLKIGLILGLFNYVVRNSVLALGLPILIHIPFNFMFTVFLLKRIGKFDWVLSTLISITAFVSALLNEIIFGGLFINLLHINPEKVISSSIEHLKLGIILDLTYVVIIPLVYFIKNYKKGKLNSVEKVSSNIE